MEPLRVNDAPWWKVRYTADMFQNGRDYGMQMIIERNYSFDTRFWFNYEITAYV